MRAAGAVPATIGVLDGRIRVGLEPSELERFTPDARKTGPRDLAACAVQGAIGATTVGGALAVAAWVGIRFLGTGGIGGVHRGFPSPPDVSADLPALAPHAGARRLLRRQVAPRRARDRRAAGDARRAGARLPHRHAAALLLGRRRAARAARGSRTRPRRRAIAEAHWELGGAGLLLANPPPQSLDVDDLIEEAVSEAAAAGVSGQAVTPFVLVVPPRAQRRSHARGQPRADRRERAAGRRDRGSVRRPVSLYDDVKDLPLEIDGVRARGPRAPGPRATSSARRRSIHLHGAGEEGIGEDVTYHGEEHDRSQKRGPVLPLAGSWTLDSLLRAPRHAAALRARARAARVPRLPPLGVRERRARPRAAPGGHLARRRGRPRAATGRVRRLDGARLATLDGAIRRVASPLPGPPLQARRERRSGRTSSSRSSPPPARSTRSTSRASTAARSSTRRPTPISTGASPKGCRTPGSRIPASRGDDAVLEPHADRVTWDAIIHSVEDIESLRWPPKTVNVKPSRFGSVERLFAAYDYCEAHGIGAYGGGQWELGPGRGQIQLLAALFHPDDAERRRAARLQPRAAARAPGEPARGRAARDRFPGPVGSLAGPSATTTCRGSRRPR